NRRGDDERREKRRGRPANLPRIRRQFDGAIGSWLAVADGDQGVEIGRPAGFVIGPDGLMTFGIIFAEDPLRQPAEIAAVNCFRGRPGYDQQRVDQGEDRRERGHGLNLLAEALVAHARRWTSASSKSTPQWRAG